jgi:glycosyltransferase involved in cell wall biosynthesis
VDIPDPAGTMTTQARPLSVCYFGTYRQEYSRNQIMIEGLRQAGVDVIECHEPLWHGIEDRVQAASGGWLRPAFIWRVLRTYWHLLGHYRRVGDYDVMVVGYPGQLDVFLARLLTWLRHKPLVWDIFMSVYLVALERGLDKHSRFTIGLLRRLEWAACRLPDRLILDTSEYVAWFGKTYGVPSQRFRLVPTGADDRVFHPIPSMPESSAFHIIYYGTFIHNHGVEYIVEAARLLADDPDIQFELIGDGPERGKAQDITNRYGLKNITFVEWLEKTELVKRVAQADVCLGAFGTTPQSLMTVQNKIYEGLAMAKPVITGYSPAVRHMLTHGEQVYLCERENPIYLAEAIRVLKQDPTLRQSIAEKGHKLYLERFITSALGFQFKCCINDLG